MAVVTGARSTGNVGSGQRTIDMAKKIALLEPTAAPLTVLTSRIDGMKKRTTNPLFQWMEDALDNRYDQINNGAGYASGITALVVDNGDRFGAQDTVLLTRTGELMRVVSVATNTLTVIRGIGTTAAAAIVDNDEVLIVASAAMEGDVSKPARTQNPVTVTNYTQIFRDPVEMTRTMMQSDTITDPHDWAYQVKKKGIEHKKSIEAALLFGQKSEDLTGTFPRRTTGGALSYITTNQTAVGGTLTEGTFFGALRPAFRYGSQKKVLFASPLLVDVLNGFPRSKVQIPDQTTDTYGLRVVKYVSPHGDVLIVKHNLLEGTKYGGYGILLDMETLAYRFLSNENGSSDTHINEHIEENDRDGRKDEWETEMGLQFGEEKRHALLTGVTG